MAAVLAGCSLETPEDGPNGAEAPKPRFALFDNRRSGPPSDAKALSRATLGKGDVVLEGPKGWCIEPSSLDARRGDNFAILAGCHALTEGRVGQPVPAGILTVTVSAPRASGDVTPAAALKQALVGEQTISSARREGVALVHLKARESATETSLGDPHWRGVFVQGRRIVSMAAYGPKGGALARGDGGTLLVALARRIRTNSPQEVVAQKRLAPKKSKLDVGTTFGRLFNRKVSE